MTTTLQLKPEVAARMYRGPRYHRSRSPAECRRLIRKKISELQWSPNPWLRYLGDVLQQIIERPKPKAA